MAKLRWWSADRDERYWLELTDRDDIGADLRAPLHDKSGEQSWRYNLFKEATIGDIVFHYDSNAQAITSVSAVASGPIDEEVRWAARGSYARERNAQPELVPGYRMQLDQHRDLGTPVKLAALRSAGPQLQRIEQALRRRYNGPLYLPFEIANRPLRLLQGYAFKLPAEVVSMFSGMADAAAAIADDLAKSRSELLGQLVRQIEAAAHRFRIGELQSLRSKLHGRRTKVRTIFSQESVQGEYAFHSGGRTELQFNIGFDVDDLGAPIIRAGVAFSFETSRTLPTIDALLPRVATFNDHILDVSESVPGLLMWSYHPRRGRTPVSSARPIDAAEVSSGSFVFLGWRWPPSEASADGCLQAFDQLLPLYEAVEGSAGRDGSATISGERTGLLLDNGKEVSELRWRTASIAERTLNVSLRHNELQKRLRELERQRGGHPTIEARIGSRSIDVVSVRADGLWFFEIKTSRSPRLCIREAIGQLLEYAFWPGSSPPVRMVVVGSNALDEDASAYLRALNDSLPVRLDYEHISIDDWDHNRN
ncbi:MAG: hypothetical protein KIT43_13000 [Bauldia sp.]|nr:hypothetical protein [Bauldia sp.]MCW5719280.1 hypothetical protein [Bauldia sp.]